MTRFDFDPNHSNEVALALYQSATIILKELAEERGDGPWIKELKENLKNQFKNAGFPDHVPLDRQPAITEDALAAIDAVFDRVKFR